MKTFTITLNEPQAHAVGLALRQTIQDQKEKIKRDPEDPWRLDFSRMLNQAVNELGTAPANEVAL